MVKNVHRKLFDTLVRNDFYTFLLMSFCTINPSCKFIPSWHINLICKILKDFENGKMKRVIINIPPRNLKSVIISAAFPAWVLAKDPTKRIIAASYSQPISERHSTDTRKIMESSWYKRIFPKSIIYGENKKNKFTTSKNGYRFATSINGTLTGEGGDIIIIDDPHNPGKIHNKGNRESVINWFQSVLFSRLNSRKNGKIILVMQRLHREDLSGFLLQNNKDEWYHLKIPSISEEDGVYFMDKIYKVAKKDMVILGTEKEINDIKKSMGLRNFYAQYQQEPHLDGDSMIKKSHISFYSKKELKTENENIFISIDAASSITSTSDYSAILIIYVKDNNFYVLDMIKDKFRYLDLKKIILKKIDTYSPNKILIEAKGVGISLLEEMKIKYLNIVSIVPKISKEIRLAKVSGIFEERRFFLPKNEYFIRDLMEELLTFPSSAHDDQVDSITQFLNWYIENSNKQNRMKKNLRISFIDFKIQKTTDTS